MENIKSPLKLLGGPYDGAVMEYEDSPIVIGNTVIISNHLYVIGEFGGNKVLIHRADGMWNGRRLIPAPKRSG